MVGAGARHLIEEILVRQLLEKGAGHAFLGELQRKAQAYGSGTDDQHAVSASIHLGARSPLPLRGRGLG